MLRVAHRDEALTLSAADIACASSATCVGTEKQRIFKLGMASEARHSRGTLQRCYRAARESRALSACRLGRHPIPAAKGDSEI